MVVAVGMNEVIPFYPQKISRGEEFEVGGLDAEDKRRLLALGSCSTKTSKSHSEDFSYHNKDTTRLTATPKGDEVEKESNNNIIKNDDEFWIHGYGKLKCYSYFRIIFGGYISDIHIFRFNSFKTDL